MPTSQRIPRTAELVLIFGLLPVVLRWLSVSGIPVPVIPILVGIALVAAVYLVRAAPSEARAAVLAAWRGRELAHVGVRVALGSALLFVFVLALYPERLFAPAKPWAWAVALAIYPLLSVLPQELLFRVFFFHRYGALWSGPLERILVSAGVFGLAHLVYGSATVVALSTVGGLFFSWTFARTGSLWLVVAEHWLYGVLVVMLGLGGLFGFPEA